MGVVREKECVEEAGLGGLGSLRVGARVRVRGGRLERGNRLSAREGRVA